MIIMLSEQFQSLGQLLAQIPPAEISEADLEKIAKISETVRLLEQELRTRYTHTMTLPAEEEEHLSTEDSAPKWTPPKLPRLPARDQNLREAFLRLDLEKQEAFLKSITYREREALKLYWGLADGYLYTLEEIGRCFKKTSSRMRQIKNGVLKKLETILSGS